MPTTPSPSAVSQFFKRLRKRWIVGSEYESYIPPTKGSREHNDHVRSSVSAVNQHISWRTPSPGSQPPVVVPHSPPETEFDVSYVKRRSLPAWGFESGIPYGQIAPHQPRPDWRSMEHLKEWRRQYRMKGGMPLWGVYTSGAHYKLDAMQILDKNIVGNRPYGDD